MGLVNLSSGVTRFLGGGLVRPALGLEKAQGGVWGGGTFTLGVKLLNGEIGGGLKDQEGAETKARSLFDYLLWQDLGLLVGGTCGEQGGGSFGSNKRGFCLTAVNFCALTDKGREVSKGCGWA